MKFKSLLVMVPTVIALCLGCERLSPRKTPTALIAEAAGEFKSITNGYTVKQDFSQLLQNKKLKLKSQFVAAEFIMDTPSYDLRLTYSYSPGDSDKSYGFLRNFTLLLKGDYTSEELINLKPFLEQSINGSLKIEYFSPVTKERPMLTQDNISRYSPPHVLVKFHDNGNKGPIFIDLNYDYKDRESIKIALDKMIELGKTIKDGPSKNPK